MCGIAGIYSFNHKLNFETNKIQMVLDALKHRGPDFQSHFSFGNCSLFHARLSIIDTSAASNQPFLNEEKTSGLAYNGEIFNYKELSKTLTGLKTHGDVEVLFNYLQNEKLNCLHKLNGFFAFAHYNSQLDELLIARDRYGVKPLYYYLDDDKLAFASELKPLLQLVGPQPLNANAINTYFRLNYVTGKETVFKNIYRLLPGESISVKNNKVEISQWYKLPAKKEESSITDLVNDSVKIRLHADVPVGSFLSGGIDSSIISAVAKQHHNNIHTFSVGFEDEPYFDETRYAEMVAKHINSNHHVFKLKNTDFLQSVQPFLNSIDEPFADSSALNFYILSKYTKPHVKVALSGDGADELFMGYNKHRAEYLSNQFLYKNLVPALSPVLNLIKGSRNSSFANKTRQLKRFSEAVKLKPQDRYMSWACISSHAEVDALILRSDAHDFSKLFDEAFSQTQFNPVNYADLKIVLSDDMLVKADRMSMQHGIEIRNPFLDYRIVELAMNLPIHQKINGNSQKVILRNNFKHLLPEAIFTRSKKGFELPLWKWLKTELDAELKTNWLSKQNIEASALFGYGRVEELLKKLHSRYPGDSPAQLWAIIVFQNWYFNFKDFIKHD